MICPKCGWLAAPSDRFCAHCGSAMEGAAPARGERRNVTIFFADLVSSTALSEQMDPEDFHAIVSAYLAKCSEVVRAFGGCVAQALGDGLMVYFGYPRANDKSVQSAIAAALEVLRVVEASGGRTPLRIRIGIHTGPVVFGDMTHEKTGVPLAFGITPNIAARIQSVAAPDSVAISDVTQKLVDGEFQCEALGAFELKGLERAIPVYRVVRERQESRSKAPMVGREAESAQLLESWKQAVDGKAQPVLVTGEPGIGKSRQLRMLTDTIALEPHFLVDLRCTPLRETSPLHPLSEFIERQFGFTRDTSPEERLRVVTKEWSRIAPVEGLPAVAPFLLASSSNVPGSSPLPPQRQRQIAFAALLGWLLEASRRRPVLLLAEDLHWADPTTLEFLGMLLASPDHRRVLCVFTARPEFRPPWPAETIAGALTELPLRRLSRADARQLAAWTARAQPVGDRVLGDLLNRAEGVPLFIEEITRSLVESRGRPGTSTPVPNDPSVEIPATLHDSLMARLDRLGSGKRLAQVASALGRDVAFAQLSAVSGLKEDALRAELTRLVDAEILVARPGPQDTFSFRHTLIQEAAYSSLLRSDRREHHAQIAKIIVEKFRHTADEQPEIVAHHFAQAGNVPESIEFLALAGQRALTRPALVEAVGAFSRALESLATLPASVERDRKEIDLRGALGLALIASKGYSAKEVEDCYGRARLLCDNTGDVPVRVLFGMWGTQFVRGDEAGIDGLVPLLEPLIVPDADPLVAMVAHATLGARAFQMGDFAPARAHLAKATALCDTADPQGQNQQLLARYGYDGLLYGPLFLAWCHVLEGNVDLGQQTFESALALAERSGHPYQISMALAFGAGMARDLGDVAQARRLSSRGLALSGESGYYFWQAISLCAAGWVDAKSGALDTGLAQIQAGLGLLGAIGSRVNRGYFLSYLAEVLLLAGRIDEGLAAVDEALSLSRSTFTRNYVAELERLRGELMLAAGQPEAADEHFQSALTRARAAGSHQLERRAAETIARVAGARGAATGAAADVKPTAPRV